MLALPCSSSSSSPSLARPRPCTGSGRLGQPRRIPLELLIAAPHAAAAAAAGGPRVRAEPGSSYSCRAATWTMTTTTTAARLAFPREAIHSPFVTRRPWTGSGRRFPPAASQREAKERGRLRGVKAGGVSVGGSSDLPVRRVFEEYSIREAKEDEYLWAAAWLRAESYCEDQPYVRFIDSYKKRFAEQEFHSLRRRIVSEYGISIKCICYIAVANHPNESQGNEIKNKNENNNSTQTDVKIDSETTSTSDNNSSLNAMERTWGSLDLSLRKNVIINSSILNKKNKFINIPFHKRSFWNWINTTDSQGEENSIEECYGYISNVCVLHDVRRKRIGLSLLSVSLEQAKNWGLKEVYVHVNSANYPAFNLYKKVGFKVAEDHPFLNNSSSNNMMDKTILLKLEL